LADVWAIRAGGAEPLGIATALTAQGDRVFQVSPVAPRLLKAQLQTLRELVHIRAVKLGMVSDRASLRAIARGLEGLPGLWVVDPVTRTSRKQRLSKLQPADYLALARRAVVLTPNLEEAGWLVGRSLGRNAIEEAEWAGHRLVDLGFGAVIVKLGRLATDVLCQRGETVLLMNSILKRRSHHRGTGCRFASALAAGLARGLPIAAAAGQAKELVRGYLS
jgi:hydroxymethylpyrimidine/phosphomethylpyrimidine kinase